MNSSIEAFLASHDELALGVLHDQDRTRRNDALLNAKTKAESHRRVRTPIVSWRRPRRATPCRLLALRPRTAEHEPSGVVFSCP
jgi:anti-sigma factor RsiW